MSNISKKHKIYTQEHCPVCKKQKKIISGQFEGYDVNISKDVVELKQSWKKNPKDALLLIDKTLDNVQNSCKANLIDEEICDRSKLVLYNKKRELEFVSNPDNKYNEILGEYYTETLTTNEFETIPTAVSSNCPAVNNKDKKKKKCIKSGLLEPINILLHNAITIDDKETINKIKKIKEKEREETLKILEKYNKNEAKKYKTFINKNNFDNEIENWFN